MIGRDQGRVLGISGCFHDPFVRAEAVESLSPLFEPNSSSLLSDHSPSLYNSHCFHCTVVRPTQINAIFTQEHSFDHGIHHVLWRLKGKHLPTSTHCSRCLGALSVSALASQWDELCPRWQPSQVRRGKGRVSFRCWHVSRNRKQNSLAARQISPLDCKQRARAKALQTKVKFL